MILASSIVQYVKLKICASFLRNQFTMDLDLNGQYKQAMIDIIAEDGREWAAILKIIVVFYIAKF